MGVSNDKVGDMDLSGSMTRQDAKTHPLDAEHTHLSNMGKMLEDMELNIRNTIEGIYIQKTREVVNGMRSSDSGAAEKYAQIVESLNQAVNKHGAARKVDST